MSGVVDFLFVYHDKFLLSSANIYLNRLMGKDGRVGVSPSSRL